VTDRSIEDLLRPLVPQVLGALVRRHGRFDRCEDAVQEAVVAAVRQWPADGVPANPGGWLRTVAERRLVDDTRSDVARRRREEASVPADAEAPVGAARDDSLTLLLLCCHPSLTPASQIALTLRAVGGLTTAEIAAAFLVPEATMAQRISRAKASIAEAGARFEPPSAAERPTRLSAVLHVLYLLYNEGYVATSGDDLVRTDLTGEAVRLTRALHDQLPEEGEAAGLLALMLLGEARRPARTRADGALVPLREQDRSRWDRALVDEGLALVAATLPTGPIGPYQLQAAIAAVHVEAVAAADTDWAQILALYELLDRVAPSPVVTLNKAIAVAEVHGPSAGLALLDTLGDAPRRAGGRRLLAVRAHLLEDAGELDDALAAYRAAARATTSRPERRYLEGRAAALVRTGTTARPGGGR
jgi:RNA polymerase sigma factor (sigma-70 family)